MYGMRLMGHGTWISAQAEARLHLWLLDFYLFVTLLLSERSASYNLV